MVDLIVGLLGQAYPARLREPFQTRGNVNAVAKNVLVPLDDFSYVQPDACLDPAFRRASVIVSKQGLLDGDCTASAGQRAVELNEETVTHALDFMTSESSKKRTQTLL